ncbi:hypothetical protein GDO86_004846 [Hymenochirus boettgeri]|uniref:Uncharacterized protein n=1 Tax=Hymenochirus boettgeri TaxID=247094 RepID=A0A8T2K9W0_9PIPI|nr:hypothetical protein GDO86_004846 [Hymenochirus boettgeri]
MEMLRLKKNKTPSKISIVQHLPQSLLLDITYKQKWTQENKDLTLFQLFFRQIIVTCCGFQFFIENICNRIQQGNWHGGKHIYITETKRVEPFIFGAIQAAVSTKYIELINQS